MKFITFYKFLVTDDTFREDLIDLLDIIAEKITTFTDKHRK